MPITFGQGELGTIEGGSKRYQLIWEDLLWAARMIEGECGARQAAGVHGEAVLWCMASRFVATAAVTYRGLCLAYSQPINPIWRRDGEKCRVGGTYHGTARCSPGALDTRDRLMAKPWEEFSDGIQNTVYNWATARTANPIPRAVHFAQPGVCRSGINRAIANGRNRTSDAGWEFVWDSTGRVEIAERGSGNCFLSTNRSRSWEQNFAKIRHENRVASDSVTVVTEAAPESQGGAAERPPLDQNGTTLSIPPNLTPTERTPSITSDRTAPPNNEHPYLVVRTAQEDTQAQRVLTEEEEESLLFINSTRFKDQASSLRNRTNIEFTQVLPVVMILAEDEDGTIVNLNEKIFSASPLEIPRVAGLEAFSDRALASIESFEVTVQQPSVGGVTGITIGNLSIKIHNPELATREHPTGKFLAYFMSQGFVVRIRYGINGGNYLSNPEAEKSFQWKEEDFFVSHYNVTLNNDKTASLKVSLMPATQRLLNQIKIGQSLPVSTLGSISTADIDSIISNVTLGEAADEQQVQQLRNRLTSFSEQLNSSAMSPGVGLEEGRISGSFGFRLHAAISNREVFDSGDALNSIPVSNFVEGVQSIQNILLTRRFQQLLENDCYQITSRVVNRNVINVGPLISGIVKPEIDFTFGIVTRNQIEIGEKFSSDSSGETAENTRSNVVLIFGKFNSRCGNLANKPISTFPVNVETMFAHLRTQRNVGEFSSTVNAFMAMIVRNIAEAENYEAESTTPDAGHGANRPRSSARQMRLEIPAVKYVIYPSPNNNTDWIMYVYDSKLPVVQIRESIDSLNERVSTGDIPTRNDVKEILSQNGIAWIEMGEEGNFIKSISAASEADDMLASHNMMMGNRVSTTIHDMDQSPEWPTGISRDFLASTNMNPQSVIRNVQYVPPVRVSVSSFVLPTAYLFAPIFVFFPIRTFSGIYLVTEVRHDIKNGAALTNLNLQLNLSVYNLMAL